jgi:hypothetical protein
MFDRIRKLSKEGHNQVDIVWYIQGPQIRTGKIEAPFSINKGDTIRATSESILGTKERIISISYENMLQDFHKDDVIFTNDGTVKLVVQDKDDKDVICICICVCVCVCEATGKVPNNKGCNMPFGSTSSVASQTTGLFGLGTDNENEFFRETLGRYNYPQRYQRPRLYCERFEPVCERMETRTLRFVPRLNAFWLSIPLFKKLTFSWIRGDQGVKIEACNVPQWQRGN